MEIQTWIDQGIEFITDFGPKVIGAILILIVSNWVIKRIIKLANKSMEKVDYDPGLEKFLVSILRWGLWILVVIMVLGTLGVETTSFAAVLAAAGLAIGLALQGSLSNFAGGVLILIFKPFRVGDVIEAQGEIGAVKMIDIFTTKLTNWQNREIIIPNGALSNGNIINYTSQGTAKVDIKIGIGYDDNIKQAKEVLMSILTDHPKILKDPEPQVAVSELGDSAIILIVRPAVLVEDYWTVLYDVLEASKMKLDEAGISIPYPQRDIHVFQENVPQKS